jgi:hypothetical protein
VNGNGPFERSPNWNIHPEPGQTTKEMLNRALLIEPSPDQERQSQTIETACSWILNRQLGSAGGYRQHSLLPCCRKALTKGKMSESKNKHFPSSDFETAELNTLNGVLIATGIRSQNHSDANRQLWRSIALEAPVRALYNWTRSNCFPYFSRP